MHYNVPPQFSQFHVKRVNIFISALPSERIDRPCSCHVCKMGTNKYKYGYHHTLTTSGMYEIYDRHNVITTASMVCILHFEHQAHILPKLYFTVQMTYLEIRGLLASNNGKTGRMQRTNLAICVFLSNDNGKTSRNGVF